MTEQEIADVVKQVCPDMLKHEAFMHDVVELHKDDYDPKERQKKMQKLTDEEYKCFCDIRDILDTATVEQVIEYLQENFKLDDKLCYMDCVEGFKNDCTYVTKDQLGKRFFYHVKDLKNRVLNETESISKKDLDDKYPYVQDDDVVVA